MKHLEEVIYDHPEKPLVEVWDVPEPVMEITADANLLVLVIRGRVRLQSGYPKLFSEGAAGDFTFIPINWTVTINASSEAALLIIRIDTVWCFYAVLSPDELYEEAKGMARTEAIRMMKGHKSIVHYVKEMEYYLYDELSTEKLLRDKIGEFFHLLRNYYAPHYQCELFLQILSPDLAFSEYVMHNYGRYHTTEELAESLNISANKFMGHFKHTFGTTPYKWMLQRKIKRIEFEMLHTKKTNHEIATGNGFLSVTQFYDFCKDQTGHTAGELRRLNKAR